MTRLERAGRDLAWWRTLSRTDRLRWSLFWAWEAWRAGEGDESRVPPACAPPTAAPSF